MTTHLKLAGTQGPGLRATTVCRFGYADSVPASQVAGRPDRRAMFEHLDGDAVVWADGTREHIDALILATGYRPELSCLTGTGALDEAGRPIHEGGVSRTVPGLGYVGLERQRFASATLRGVGRDAAHVLRLLDGVPTGSAAAR